MAIITGIISIIALGVSIISLVITILGYKVRKDNTLFRKFAGNEKFGKNEIEYFIRSNKKHIEGSKKDKYNQKDENGKTSKKGIEVMATHKCAKMIQMVFEHRIPINMPVEQVIETVMQSNLKDSYGESKEKENG